MRYILGAFVVWLLVRKRVAVYTSLATTSAKEDLSSEAPKGA